MFLKKMAAALDGRSFLKTAGFRAGNDAHVAFTAMEPSDFRLPCTICQRKFAPEALERHAKICEKTAQKKRKTFDSARQRILGTDITTIQSAPPQLYSSPAAPKRSNANRPKPRLYIGGGGNNKETSTNSGGRGPPTSFLNRLNAGLVQCPSCERNFNDKAADRHIPWCKELRSRIPRSPPCTKAKHRLDARIQYKAPKLGKRRNSPTRSLSKTGAPYPSSVESLASIKSPISPPASSIGTHGVNVNVTGTAIQARLRRIGTPSTNNGNNNNHDVNGGMIHSSSWEYFEDPRIIRPVAVKRPVTIKETNKQPPERPPKPHSNLSRKAPDNYDPFESAQRQMEELLLSSSPSSPIMASKPTSQHRNQQSNSNDSSAWSLTSDKDVEEIEEDIVVFEDDPVFEEIISMHTAPIKSGVSGGSASIRHLRRPVSREEALFGSKNNTTASQDSDYGSLLRRSPSTPVRLSIDPAGVIVGSSSSRSSSEASLPPLIAGDAVASLVKMSRFCHECGTKYPIVQAKFCCECGIRRLCV